MIDEAVVVRVHIREGFQKCGPAVGYEILPNGCWQWFGALNHQGYGIIGRHERAHRHVYERLRGPIPDGLVLDHLCKNTACVNPDHLEPVTQRENLFRARKTHCKHGHALEGDNLYFWHGNRRCVTCNNESSKCAKARMRNDPERHAKKLAWQREYWHKTHPRKSPLREEAA